MKDRLGGEKVNKLLWSLSIPATLGMLSSAIFNIADRYFIGKVDPLALSGVGITMPVQLLQMAVVLLLGLGSSTLVSVKIGEGDYDGAEKILHTAFKAITISMAVFGVLVFLFLDPLFSMLSVSKEVYPYARDYLLILMLGSVFGIPGYCLNNSLRSIGYAKVSMLAVLYTSILNIFLDPLLIFVFKMGVAGAALATVISQTCFTIFIIYYFSRKGDIVIKLRFKKYSGELKVLKDIIAQGSPSFWVQILASVLNVYINKNFVFYGSDLDVASITIITTVFSFYHMLVYGFVQGTQPIIGYNLGSRQFDRVKKALELGLLYSFIISVLVFILVEVFPREIVSIFTDDAELLKIASHGIKIYLFMIPLIGPQTIITQYYVAVQRPRLSTFLLILRYGVILVPAMLILAPRLGPTGIYMSNAISDGLASVVAFIFIVFEIKKLNKLVS